MDITTYQTLLRGELDLVTEELKTLGIEDPHNTKDWIALPTGTDVSEADENTAADHVEELEEREAILADLEARFNATTLALKKIADGTYGVCEVCSDAIEEDRLHANPAARTCKEHREEILPLT